MTIGKSETGTIGRAVSKANISWLDFTATYYVIGVDWVMKKANY